MNRQLLIITLVGLLVFENIDCRKTGFGRRKSKSNSNSGTGTSASTSSGGWFSWGSSSKTTSVAKPSTTNTKPADTSGWKRVDTNQQTNYGWNKAVLPSGNTGTKTGQNYGFTNPSTGTRNTQTGQGWSNPNYKPDIPKANNAASFKPKPNAPPSANIGPGGYPVQSGMGYPHNTGMNTGLNTNRGYNTGYHQTGSYHPSGGYNTGFSQGGYNTHGGYSGYQAPHFGAASYPSSHGFSSSYYPSHNTFGYPGQGLFGGSKGPKYGGMGIFGGGSGHYGYPSSGSWGYPSYGTGGFGHKSGSGSMMKGLAIGAVGGYLTSSLIHKVTNPWGYGGYGYGNSYGYDRGSYWRRNRDEYGRAEATQTPPQNNFIPCVVIDPTTNSTLVNPNCTCTVTTVNDPITNQPISTHNCNPLNGEGPPQKIVETPNQGLIYENTQTYAQNYGVYSQPEQQFNATSTSVVEGSTSNGTDTPETQKQTSGGDHDIVQRRNEFYSRLEKLVNMGKFST